MEMLFWTKYYTDKILIFLTHDLKYFNFVSNFKLEVQQHLHAHIPMHIALKKSTKKTMF